MENLRHVTSSAAHNTQPPSSRTALSGKQKSDQCRKSAEAQGKKSQDPEWNAQQKENMGEQNRKFKQTLKVERQMSSTLNEDYKARQRAWTKKNRAKAAKNKEEKAQEEKTEAEKAKEAKTRTRVNKTSTPKDPSATTRKRVQRTRQVLPNSPTDWSENYVLHHKEGNTQTYTLTC